MAGIVDRASAAFSGAKHPEAVAALLHYVHAATTDADKDAIRREFNRHASLRGWETRAKEAEKHPWHGLPSHAYFAQKRADVLSSCSLPFEDENADAGEVTIVFG